MEFVLNEVKGSFMVTSAFYPLSSYRELLTSNHQLIAVKFFDCNCMVGKRTAPRPENNLSLEQILEQLEYAGIEEALVVHSYSKEYDPLIGNEMISEICVQQRNLHPCYVVLPHHAGEMRTGDELIKYVEDGGAEAVRMYPVDHNYGLGEAWCGKLLGALAEARVPVFLDFEQTSWSEIDATLGVHQDLNLVVVRPTYRVNRWMFPLLEKYKRLRFEISFYDVHFGIETVTERFGSERMLFGTALPEYDAGAMVGLVQYAKISVRDKENIASRNLESLLWRSVKPEKL